MNTVSIFASMRAPLKYAAPGACCNFGTFLADDETYICQSCNDEIDRRADETLGNSENEND
uniref:hypothetical protein n=1 Tax=Serratia quinivorans TaxID=137545 RepID=UPI0035C6628B